MSEIVRPRASDGAFGASGGEQRVRTAPENEATEPRRRPRDRDRADSSQIRQQPRTQFDERRWRSWRSRSASAACSSRSCCGRTATDYQIVAGERRWRAAQRAQLHAIPAIVREIDEATTAELALIENIQREDLNAIEEAEGYRQLIQRHGQRRTRLASWSTSRAATWPICCAFSNCRPSFVSR